MDGGNRVGFAGDQIGLYVMSKLYDHHTYSQTIEHANLTSIQKFAIGLIVNAVTGLSGMAISGGGGKRTAKLREKKRIEYADQDRKWFLSENTEIPSFIWCCDILDASPSYLRKIFLPLYMNAQKNCGAPKTRMIL